MDFVINLYAICVENIYLYGKQYTIVWFVDENKISHADPTVVTYILGHLKKYFGDLIITIGKK